MIHRLIFSLRLKLLLSLTCGQLPGVVAFSYSSVCVCIYFVCYFSPSCLGRVLHVTWGSRSESTAVGHADNFEIQCLYDVWYTLVGLICLMNCHQEIRSSLP